MSLLKRRKRELLAELNRVGGWVDKESLGTLRNDARGRRALRELVRDALVRQNPGGRIRITGWRVRGVGPRQTRRA